MKGFRVLLGMALVTGACFGEDGPAKPDSTLEIVQFKAPAGWQAAERPGQAGKVYTSPDSSGAQQAVILLAVSPAQEGLKLGVAFDAAIKDVISNGKLLESTDAVASKTRQGFEAMSRTLVIQSEGGQRVYARMIAAKVLVTMTPVGPLIDGSRGETIAIDVDVAELNYSTDRRNIPLGTYKITAVLTAKDGGKLALACSRSPGANFGESAEIWWESSRDDAESRGDPAVYLKD